MRRTNCNLELQLLPPSSDSLLLSSDYKSSYDHLPKLDFNNNGSKKQEQKELTIFYNGKMVSCDVTELQARAIILHASRVNEEIHSKFPSINSSQMMQPQQHHQQLYAPTSLSMKKSLQQFLQKRKNRLQSASPYNHH